MDIKKLFKYISICFAALLIIVLSFLFFEFGVSDILGFVSEPSYTAAIIIIAFFCIKPVIWAIPQAVLCISAGAIFPLGWAIVIVLVGNFLELTIGYLMGKFLGKEVVAILIEKSERAKKFFTKGNPSKPSLCVIASLAPLPKSLVSIFFGASALNYASFILFSKIGHTPALTFYLLTGYAILPTIL
jgi:uncharacterized membrane protein YdjX (TVP38/TMEM64 family)